MIESTDVLTDSALRGLSAIEDWRFTNLFIHPQEMYSVIFNSTSNVNPTKQLKSVVYLSDYVTPDNLVVIDLGNEWGHDIAYNSLGDEITTVNISNLDKKISEYITDIVPMEILEEQTKCEIYNASEVPHLAFRLSRRITNSGVQVIRYENSPSVFEQTTIFLPQGEDKYDDSVNQILLSIGLSEKDVKFVAGRPDWMTTGDIVLVIGKDIQ
jgi:hypothetical protein